LETDPLTGANLDSAPAVSDQLAEDPLTGNTNSGQIAGDGADALIYGGYGIYPSTITIENLVVAEDASGVNAGLGASGGSEPIAAIAPGGSSTEGSLFSQGDDLLTDPNQTVL
jgi:hypothetical protein